MIYDIIPLKLKLETAVAEWNRERTPESVMEILDTLDAMNERNDEVYVPFYEEENGFLVAASDNENWIPVYTSKGAETVGEVPLRPVHLRELFQSLFTERGKDIAGIVINPAEPFFLLREIVRMNWGKDYAPHSVIRIRAFEKPFDAELNVQTCKAPDTAFPLLKADPETGKCRMDIPEHIRDSKHQSALRNAVWNLLELVGEQKIRSVSFPFDLYESEEENLEAAEILCIAVKMWDTMMETGELDWTFVCDKEKKNQLNELIEGWMRDLTDSSRN